MSDNVLPEFNNIQANKEGWGIHEYSGLVDQSEMFRLEKIDIMDKFETDQEAWSFVVRKAESGSQYHIDALSFIRQYSPIEFFRVMAK